MTERDPNAEAIWAELDAILNISRRDMVVKGFKGGASAAAMLALSTIPGCKTVGQGGSAVAGTSGMPAGASFLASIAAAEAATPVPTPAAPNDAAYQAATRNRAAEVARTIAIWLAADPYKMLAELHAQPVASMPIFKREFGPAIIFRKDSVIKAFEATDTFKVDLYAGEMKRGTDGNFNSQKFSHFILGTDDEALYRPDSILLRRVLSKKDMDTLIKLVRGACDSWVQKFGKSGKMDTVETLCRYTPVTIVQEYLGIPTFAAGEKGFTAAQTGGQEFAIRTDLKSSFQFSRITKGVCPTPEILYGWVRDAFRNIFNNFGGLPAKFTSNREKGMIATEYLTVWTHECLVHFKAEMAAGRQVPDTMLTRLLALQAAVNNDKAPDLLTDMKLAKDKVVERLKDGMIRSNVFGTVTGAVVNPEEGNARVINAFLNFKEDADKDKGKITDDGKRHYKVQNGSTYDALVTAAAGTDDASWKIVRRYMLELLRLQPQGEVVARACVKTTSDWGGPFPIQSGTTVFVSQAGAMQDPAANPNALDIDITRDEMLKPFEATTDRPNEEPQSQTYLQHGFGRHKCLGRYASEINMVEILRCVVNLGDVKRESELVMDDDGLYAMHLAISFPPKP